jgi:hypothetical protein
VPPFGDLKVRHVEIAAHQLLNIDPVDWQNTHYSAPYQVSMIRLHARVLARFHLKPPAVA